jgi:hypothetical protein
LRTRIVVLVNSILLDEGEGEADTVPSTVVGEAELSKAMDEDEAVTWIVMDEAEQGTAEVVVVTAEETPSPSDEVECATLIEMIGGRVEVTVLKPRRQTNGSRKIEPSNLRRTLVLLGRTTPNLASGERMITRGTTNMNIDLDKADTMVIGHKATISATFLITRIGILVETTSSVKTIEIILDNMRIEISSIKTGNRNRG